VRDNKKEKKGTG